MLEHLLERRCDPQTYTTVHYDDSRATFMLYALTGRLQGYQVHTPHLPKTRGNSPRDQRYFTYSPKLTATPWGLESYDPRRPLCVVEGVFDACALHDAGYPAVAVLGNNVRMMRNLLSCLPVPTIAVCDGDAPWRKLARLCDYSIMLGDGLDCGDISRDGLIDKVGKFFI